MLQKAHRLRAPADFRRVYGRGRSYVDPLLVLYVARTSDPNQLRFGFSVSKKVGGAVVRNRLRRRLQEACRQQIDSGSIVWGLDLIVVARNRAKEATYQILCQTLIRLFTLANILRTSEEPAEQTSRADCASE